MKPIIGITINYITDDSVGISAGAGGKSQTYQIIADDYVKSVIKAGGIPVLIPIVETDYLELISMIDGIIFSGGCDVNPLEYGVSTKKEVGSICVERDNQELFLLKTLLKESNMPILGICRGCQIMNVSVGGTLTQDIDTSIFGNHFYPEQLMKNPTHYINTTENSRIRKILGEKAKVNSYHHQCVEKCGEDIIITAKDENGIVECIEFANRKAFAMGVQWHPEAMVSNDELQLNVIKLLINASTQYRMEK